MRHLKTTGAAVALVLGAGAAQAQSCGSAMPAFRAALDANTAEAVAGFIEEYPGCFTAPAQAKLAALGGAPAAAPAPAVAPAGSEPVFGDDSGAYPNDGECDDPRFTGEGMASTLSSGQRFADATDCSAFWNAGGLRLADGEYDGSGAAPDFGDDSGNYTNDDECDDPRFTGAGMTATRLIEADVRADATDCRSAWDRGDLSWRTE